MQWKKGRQLEGWINAWDYFCTENGHKTEKNHDHGDDGYA